MGHQLDGFFWETHSERRSIEPTNQLTGGRVSYYLADVAHPQREDQPAYRAECEDIIETLEMTPDEALLLKCYDSATDGRTRFGPHTAFVDPATPADVAPRESIEVRTLVFHKQ